MNDVPTKKPDEPAPARPGRTQAGGPFLPFSGLRHEIERLFDEFDGGVFRVPAAFGGALAPGARPAVDIVEKDDAFELTAELPGMSEDQVHIEVDQGVLSLKGEKQEVKEEKRKGYHLSERRFGSFERRFPLPQGVDEDAVKAAFANGVLTVTMPKKPEAKSQARKVPIGN